MVTSKKAIKKFLNRDLNSYDWMKDCYDDELDDALHDMFPSPKFKTNPYFHQTVCFILLEELKRFILLLEMGLGKTKICLDYISYMKRSGRGHRTIVFVPYITGIDTWLEEAETHAPNLTCIALDGTSQENLDMVLNEEGDVFIICYQSAAAMLHHKEKTKKGKNRWNVDSKRVKKIFKDFDILIMDEIHKIKNRSSLYYRICLAISKISHSSIGLTGTPFGDDPTDLWSQFHVIDFGETLGSTLGLFREAFFNEKPGYWGGFKYKFKKTHKKRLHKMMKHRSIRFTEDECFDMPKSVTQSIKVNFPKGIRAYYDKADKLMKKLIIEKKKNYRQIQSAYIQTRQLSSGFMTLKGDDSESVKIEFDDNPKIDALLALIDEMPKDRKMIVFHHFVHTNRIISNALKKEKIPHARVWGKQKNPRAEIKKFKKDPNCRILVINTTSGSSTLNLQVANYLVFFEIPESLIDLKQAIKRVLRGGQIRKVFQYFLLMKGSNDEKRLKYIEEGEDMFTAIMDGRERSL